jgi:nucleotide-binding universal stress UspA family protein
MNIITNWSLAKMKFQKILVPLDGSGLAEQAIAPALMLAEAMTAKVVFLRVAVPLALNIDPQLYQRIIETNTNKAKRYLRSVQDRFSPSVATAYETVVGPAAKAIINYAQEYEIDLILMSSSGRFGLSQWRHASVAERVLRCAPCATAIMRAQIETTPFAQKHILVPLDGSPQAEQALELAINIAKAVAAKLTLLRVTNPARSRGSFGLISLSKKTKKGLHKIEKRTRMEAAEYLHNVRATMLRNHVPIKVAVATGDDMTETIIDQADKLQADLIIMPKNGRSLLNRWVFGSVAEKIVRNANCATLVVQGQEVAK